MNFKDGDYYFSMGDIGEVLQTHDAKYKGTKINHGVTLKELDEEANAYLIANGMISGKERVDKRGSTCEIESLNNMSLHELKKRQQLFKNPDLKRKILNIEEKIPNKRISDRRSEKISDHRSSYCEEISWATEMTDQFDIQPGNRFQTIF